MRIDLIFLSNELMNPSIQRECHVPLEFLTCGFVKGQLYTLPQRKGTFLACHAPKRKWSNPIVYGALFHVPDYHFYIRTLDAYHGCSKSSIGRNHPYDLQHRMNVTFTPITFSSLDDFAHLRYVENESMSIETYVGNLNHPKLKQRVTARQNMRIMEGINKTHFKSLISEVYS